MPIIPEDLSHLQPLNLGIFTRAELQHAVDATGDYSFRAKLIRKVEKALADPKRRQQVRARLDQALERTRAPTRKYL